MVIDCVNHSLTYQKWILEDPRAIDCVRRARFFIHSQLRWIRLDHLFFTALIGRWRPETSGFYLQVGEMTMMLQDVAVLLGPIDGLVVTTRDDRGWMVEFVRLLGRQLSHRLLGV